MRSARLHIAGLGRRELLRVGSYRRVLEDDFLVLFFHSSVRVGCRCDAMASAEGGLYLASPSASVFYDVIEGGVFSWFRCGGRLWDRWLKNYAIPLDRLIPAIPEEASDIFLRQIHRELSASTMPDARIIENVLEIWLRDLARHLTGRLPTIPDKLMEAKDFLDLHFAQDLSLKDVAGRTGWSPPHFSSEFRKCFGRSPFEYLITRRLEAAASLLRDADLNVTQVAESVGYEDVYYFSKLFKKHMGRSPSTLRAQSFRGG